MRPTDLRDSLQRAISLVTKAYSDKAIELSLSVPDGAAVLADDLLDEVFANILSNSVKYTQGQTVSISIKTEPMERGGWVRPLQPGPPDADRRGWRIDLEDKGRGIPNEIKEKVFTRYATASSGSGLGLSIVHALVTGRYKGDVRVQNRVENDFSEGTRIEVWLSGAD